MLYVCEMERYFKTQEGLKVDVVDHTLEQIKKFPTLKMHIGTDSQDYGAITRFVTVIVYRYGTKGAHFIYSRDEVPRMSSMYNRLYDEGVKTIEAAGMITEEIPVSFEAVEFDYNYIPKWASHKLISAIGGWASGLNMKAMFKNTKDSIMLATKAADHVCRHSDMYK